MCCQAPVSYFPVYSGSDGSLPSTAGSPMAYEAVYYFVFSCISIWGYSLGVDPLQEVPPSGGPSNGDFGGIAGGGGLIGSADGYSNCGGTSALGGGYGSTTGIGYGGLEAVVVTAAAATTYSWGCQTAPRVTYNVGAGYVSITRPTAPSPPPSPTSPPPQSPSPRRD